MWVDNSQYAYFQTLEELSTSGGAWLDIGCGRQLFPDWMTWDDQRQAKLVAPYQSRVGLDLDFEYMKLNHELSQKVMGSADQLPFADASFDLITANMVVEHVADPVGVLSEIARVLRAGGRFAFHTPNVLYPTMLAGHLADTCLPQRVKDAVVSRIEGRDTEDVFPTRYRLNRMGRIRKLARNAGFEIESLATYESIPSSMRRAPIMGVSELFFMWTVRKLRLRSFRSNIIAVLRKPL